MSSKRIEIHPEALAEAENALSWYAERSTRAPEAFLTELERAVSSVLESPRSWPIIDGDCRRFPLIRFPYLVIYREKTPELVQIVAIAHGRRRPGYWRTRIR